jgi:RNA polymerase sigma factor (sigma-70 family)
MQASSEGRRAAPRAARQRFLTTRWSLVVQAAEPGGAAALAALCRDYWTPVHAFIQGHGVSSEDAADVTQEFFEALLARNAIARVDQARGQFRSWLRSCARNHLYNWFAKRRGLAVGGRAVHVSADLHADELRNDETAERLFDRRWALTVLERALSRLKARYERAGKGDLFTHLHGGLGGGGGSEHNDKELSILLGKSVGAIKVERHRLKRRFQECLRAEVLETVASPSDVDEELKRLIEALT